METEKLQVFIVKEGSPAFGAIKRFFGKRQMKQGRVLPVSDAEFDSFRNDFIELEIHKKKTSGKNDEQ